MNGNEEQGELIANTNFESLRKENGIIFWWASELMQELGYSSMASFRKVIDRATRAFLSLEIPHHENIIPRSRDINGSTITDYKLTRFACYIVAMNADPKKPEVAKIQAYLATQARAFQASVERSKNELDRISIRQELIDGNKALNQAAKEAGVENYAFFQNAGYLGLYNQTSGQLKDARQIKGDLAETMGRTELAANLFRVTQTEERIKTQNIRGQKALERTHRAVGKVVRGIVKDNTGRYPEDLPQEQRILEVKKELKSGYNELKQKDGKNKIEES